MRPQILPRCSGYVGSHIDGKSLQNHDCGLAYIVKTSAVRYQTYEINYNTQKIL